MNTPKQLLIALGAFVLGVTSASADATRTFTDSQGHKVEATFVKLDGDTVYITLLATGQTFGLPLSRFSDEDQKLIIIAAILHTSRDPAEYAALGGLHRRGAKRLRLRR